MPRLHVPQPPTRPGDKPDFSYVDLSPAGAINKPDVNARARDMEECATGLVRVLDDKHEPVGQWNRFGFGRTQGHAVIATAELMMPICAR